MICGLLLAALALGAPIEDSTEIPVEIVPSTSTDQGSIELEGPFRNCGSPSDLLTIEKIVISPNPPQVGQLLKLSASGVTSETILPGAIVSVSAKIGLITVVSKTIDACAFMGDETELKCPIAPGPYTLGYSVDIPANVPKLSYKIKAVAKNADEKQITCIEGTVKLTLDSGDRNHTLDATPLKMNLKAENGQSEREKALDAELEKFEMALLPNYPQQEDSFSGFPSSKQPESPQRLPGQETPQQQQQAPVQQQQTPAQQQQESTQQQQQAFQQVGDHRYMQGVPSDLSYNKQASSVEKEDSFSSWFNWFNKKQKTEHPEQTSQETQQSTPSQQQQPAQQQQNGQSNQQTQQEQVIQVKENKYSPKPVSGTWRDADFQNLI